MTLLSMPTASAVDRGLFQRLHGLAAGLRRAGAVCALALLSLLALPAQAGISGLWAASNGDYELFLQDATTGTTFALQVPATFKNIKVWMGTGSPTAISLQNLTAPADSLVASISNGTAMNGSLTQGGTQQPFAANLALGWVATEQSGVWQKANMSNAYLVFALLNTGSGHLAVQIDVTLNADKTITSAVYTGTFNNNVFNGLSLTGDGMLSRLTFSGSKLQGTVTTPTRPPASTAFSATQIVQIGP